MHRQRKKHRQGKHHLKAEEKHQQTKKQQIKNTDEKLWLTTQKLNQFKQVGPAKEVKPCEWTQVS